mgnify:CR=1 FL=1
MPTTSRAARSVASATSRSPPSGDRPGRFSRRRDLGRDDDRAGLDRLALGRVPRGDEDFRLLVDTALSEAYYSGYIEKAYDQYLGGSNLTVKRLFRVYALP